MGVDRTRQAFARAAMGADLAIVEGNRGLYDGVDAAGTHSTAELAKAIDAPVLLVIDTRKVTRTVAAFGEPLSPQQVVERICGHTCLNCGTQPCTDPDDIRACEDWTMGHGGSDD